MIASPLRLFAPALAVALVAAACGGNDAPPDMSTAAAGGNGGVGGAGTASNSGGFSPNGSGGMGGMETCLASIIEAPKKPLDMVVVWDRSTSMNGAKWAGTVMAVTEFVNDPVNAGIRLGLNFFPLAGAADQCDASIHNPPQLGLTNIPADAQNVSDAINTTSPGGLTPTYGALLGTLQFLTAHQNANPDNVVVAVLASDGDPTECNTNIDAIAALAQDALVNSGVSTYVIAIEGSTLSALDTIAAAGGTTQAIDITNDVGLFLQAMEDIRQTEIGCSFTIPEPTSGDPFDPQKLNVSYTVGMDPAVTIPNVANEAACGADPGWYYDDAANPTEVILCPATCSLVNANPEVTIDLQFGCPTIIQ